MKSTNINILKKELITALGKTLGVVTTACKLVEIDRTTFYNYYNSDSEFKKQVDDIQNIAIDFVESKLFENIKNGNSAEIIFYLKTKGKKRGYVEKSEQDLNVKFEEPIIIDWNKNYKPENE